MDENNEVVESFEERLNRQTRPPSGQRLNLHSLRFAEVIRISEIENLKKGFDQFYEEKLHVDNAIYFSSDQDSYCNFFSRSKITISSSGYTYLQGFISKACADRITEGVITRPVRELPSGIDSISFLLCQLVPSSIIVVTKMEFDDSISDTLNLLLNKEYIERREKHENGTTSVYSPDKEKEAAVQDYLSQLQFTCESFMAQYFTGCFLSEKTNIPIKCPSLKQYSLQDIPFDSMESLTKWIQDNRFFIDMLGYSAVPSWTYQYGNAYLLFKENHRQEEKPVYFSLLTSESLFGTPENYDGYGTPMWAVKHKYGYGFDALMPLLAMYYLLLWHSRKLVVHRNTIDSNVALIETDLNKQYSAAHSAKISINSDYFEFVRVMQELGRVTPERFESRLYGETPKFELVENHLNRSHFAKEMVEMTNFVTDNLVKEYTLLNERYSDTFKTISIQSNFILNESNVKYQKSVARLTWALVVLTVVMTVTVVIQITKG